MVLKGDSPFRLLRSRPNKLSSEKPNLTNKKFSLYDEQPHNKNVSLSFFNSIDYYEARNIKPKRIQNAEKMLYRYLLADYEKDSRPVLGSENVTVLINLVVVTIMAMDERNQILTTHLWVDQKWRDAHLTWNPDDFNGIVRTQIPATQIWVPDTFIYNTADEQFSGFIAPSTLGYLLVQHDGKVHWPHPLRLKSTCRVNIRYFPFDSQTCTIRIGSWSYNGHQVYIKNEAEKPDITEYTQNTAWELISAKLESRIRIYKSWPEPFPEIMMHLRIRRRPLYYTYNVIIPCILLSALTTLTFALPADTGERVTLGVNIFLAISVFMLLVAEQVPETSESVPLLGVYFTIVMVTTFAAIAWAIFIINILRSAQASKAPPIIPLKIIIIIAPFIWIRVPAGLRSEMAEKKLEQIKGKKERKSFKKNISKQTSNLQISGLNNLSQRRLQAFKPNYHRHRRLYMNLPKNLFNSKFNVIQTDCDRIEKKRKWLIKQADVISDESEIVLPSVQLKDRSDELFKIFGRNAKKSLLSNNHMSVDQSSDSIVAKKKLSIKSAVSNPNLCVINDNNKIVSNYSFSINNDSPRKTSDDLNDDKTSRNSRNSLFFYGTGEKFSTKQLLQQKTYHKVPSISLSNFDFSMLVPIDSNQKVVSKEKSEISEKSIDNGNDSATDSDASFKTMKKKGTKLLRRTVLDESSETVKKLEEKNNQFQSTDTRNQTKMNNVIPKKSGVKGKELFGKKIRELIDSHHSQMCTIKKQWLFIAAALDRFFLLFFSIFNIATCVVMLFIIPAIAKDY
ncbi:hypothetical protein SNEBB_008064 [Seison nebaliae]|nr:hypothetical protein SNEBB_008064 [Seison nebaliae]